MKSRRQLRHDLSGFTRSDSELLLLALWSAVDFVERERPAPKADQKKVRRALIQLLSQIGAIMEGQQAAEHRGLLPPLHGWEQFDSMLSQQAKM